MIRHIICDKLFRYILIGLATMLGLSLGSAVCHSSTVTGTFKYNNTPFTGWMTYQLNYPATQGTYINLPIVSAPIPVSNGQFASLSIDGNDTLLPRGSYYAFNLYDQYGKQVVRLNYVITGANFDLGAAVPTPVLTNNVSFLDLLGIRNFSALNATFTNQIQIGNGTIINRPGIQNAENIMGILFAQAFNIQNPSSTTCGIQEAETALPATGGTIILQPGVCNASDTIQIIKPTVLMGMGQAGFADSSTFTTYNSPTTLNETGTGILVQVSPAAGTTLSGVSLINIALTGASGSGDLLSLGNAGSTTAYLRDVRLDGVLMSSGQGSGISITGNLYGLSVTNTTITHNAGYGVSVVLAAGYTVDAISIGSHTNITYNGVDGVFLSGAGVKGVTIDGALADHNTGWGVDIQAASTASTVSMYQSGVTSNTAGGILVAAGTGHVVESSTVASNGGYGVSITAALASGYQTLSLKDDTFIPANTTYDVSNGSTAYVLMYPHATQSPAVNGTLNYIYPGQLYTFGNNSNGYWSKDPTGKIHQWGHLTGENTGSCNVITFPVAFTNAASIGPGGTDDFAVGSSIQHSIATNSAHGCAAPTTTAMEDWVSSSGNGIWWTADGY
jgi:hypothetical protein